MDLGGGGNEPRAEKGKGPAGSDSDSDSDTGMVSHTPRLAQRAAPLQRVLPTHLQEKNRL